MKWRSSVKKEGSNNSRRETLESYEQKYLEKFNKVKSEIHKIQKKQKDVEVKELKDRIARRLKLEKEGPWALVDYSGELLAVYKEHGDGIKPVVVIVDP